MNVQKIFLVCTGFITSSAFYDDFKQHGEQIRKHRTTVDQIFTSTSNIQWKMWDRWQQTNGDKTSFLDITAVQIYELLNILRNSKGFYDTVVEQRAEQISGYGMT